MRGPLLSGPVLAGDEHVAIREFSEYFRRLAKICGEHVLGICRNPLRQVDGFVAPARDHGIATEPEQPIAVVRPFLAILVQETCGGAFCERRIPKGPV